MTSKDDRLDGKDQQQCVLFTLTDRGEVHGRTGKGLRKYKHKHNTNTHNYTNTKANTMTDGGEVLHREKMNGNQTKFDCSKNGCTEIKQWEKKAKRRRAFVRRGEAEGERK